MRSPRFLAVVLLLLVTAGLLHLRGDVDRVPPSEPLSELPRTIGPWSSTDIPIDAAVLEILGKGVFLNRIYAAAPAASSAPAEVRDGSAGPVGLFIGYFPTQRTGQAIHSPQNCLPGAGWLFESSGIAVLKDRDGRSYRVGEYLISNGRVKQEVLYWYRSHGRTMANDYVAKLYTLLDSMRYNRTDAALVRVITPVQDGESGSVARARAVGFAEQVTPLLPAYIPD